MNETSKKCCYFAVFLTLTILLFSCAHAPTSEEIQSADYGPYPDNYEDVIKSYYSRSLFDPYSAIYTFDMSPRKGWASGMSGASYGWVVCGTLNGKNRYGGYVGAKPIYVMIRYGSVAMAEEGYLANSYCSKAGR